MNKIAFVMLAVVVLAGGSLAAQGVQPPLVTSPIGRGEPPTEGSIPPHWIPKRPGHYSLTDWRRVIDSTWGDGLPVDEKLAILDLAWQVIDSSFGCFNNLADPWSDSLRTIYRTEIISDTVSRGRFAAIMNHLAFALMEGHTNFKDRGVIDSTALLPGVPVWMVGGWADVGHFGAALSPLPDSSLLVYRVADGHPFGLERGDIVLGYDRRPWTEILRELLEAQLPIRRWGGLGGTSSSRTYTLLNAAGLNWHLFDTIDIVRYATGDTVHLPTRLLVGQNMHVLATDQMDIPGVPMPDTSFNQAVSFGIVTGTRIGYIYCWSWMYASESEFEYAVRTLTSDTSLVGLIVDFRNNEGGYMPASNAGLSHLFRDTVETICFSERSDPRNHLAMWVSWPASNWVIPGGGRGYDKPIAVLVGPAAGSAGDLNAFRIALHPRVRTFGKSTWGAFNSPVEFYVHDGWFGRYAFWEACPASDTTYFLTHREFPVDVPVWHTREAVARGEDTVVTVAMAWIDSVSAVAEPRPTLAATEPTSIASIVCGVLWLAPASSPKLQASRLLDVSGRKVQDLRPGPNDVRHLVPGVYFARRATGEGRVANSKVIVTR